jgi:hypothetical protein
MSEETWIQQQEKNILFRNQSRGADANRLLEIGRVNRTIIDRDQAILLMVGRVISRRMKSLYTDKNKYQWIDDICDLVESHQQTMSGETNSRIQFMKVAIAQFAAKLSDMAKSGGDNVKK